MQLRTIGRTDIRVAPLVLGTNVFGWTANEEASFAVLDAFVDHGLNFVDTADVYSAWSPGHRGGESETIIGRWIKASGKRDKIVVATKVGMLESRAGLSASNIEAAVEDSLRRLQTDRIDVYFSHVDDAKTPLEETLSAHDKLIRAGKVRVIGCSNIAGARIGEALSVSRERGWAQYQVVQPEYNLMAREAYEKDIEPVAVDNDLAVVTYFSLAAGFLTGKYRSRADAANKARSPQVVRYLNERGFHVLDVLTEIAARLDSTPAAVALAWLIARPSVTAPIASATSVAQLHALAAAVRLKLDAPDLEALEAVSRPEAGD